MTDATEALFDARPQRMRDHAPDCPAWSGAACRCKPNDRCNKCGSHISEWAKTPCVQSLTQSPRHTITRFHIGEP